MNKKGASAVADQALVATPPNPQAVSAEGFDPSRMAYVVMGNDYPDAAFTTEAAAEAYCEAKRISDREDRVRAFGANSWEARGPARIYWRVYAFPLQTGESA